MTARRRSAPRRRTGAKRSRAKRKPYIQVRQKPPANRFVMGLYSFIQAIRHVATGGESTWGPARKLAAKPAPRCSECGQPLDQEHAWSHHNPLEPSREWPHHLPLSTADGRPNMTAHKIKEDPS